MPLDYKEMNSNQCSLARESARESQKPVKDDIVKLQGCNMPITAYRKTINHNRNGLMMQQLLPRK